jgi:hypothetical protein
VQVFEQKRRRAKARNAHTKHTATERTADGEMKLNGGVR